MTDKRDGVILEIMPDRSEAIEAIVETRDGETIVLRYGIDEDPNPLRDARPGEYVQWDNE